MTPSNDQYDTTVEKIDTAETLANTGLDMLPLFGRGSGCSCWPWRFGSDAVMAE